MSKPEVRASDADSARVLGLVLNWNGAQDTINLLRSLQKIACPAFDVLVLDNASSDGSVENIRSAFPLVDIVRTGANLGYAGGNNVGLRLALKRGYDFAFILNNDLTVAPEVLERLLLVFKAHPDVGIAGPKVYRSDKPDELFYPAWKIDLEKWLFYRVPSLPDPSGVTDVDFVQGCALMIRRELLEAQVLFDERFHLYCEDADLALRARQADWRTVEVEEAKVWHRGYGSSGRHSPLKTYYSLRNRLLFIRKHGRRPWALRWRLLLFDAGRTFADAMGDVLHRRFATGSRTIRALCRAVVDWLRGAYGKGPEWLFSRHD